MHLFVYGTLLFPEIIQALTGNIFRQDHALLSNYKRYSIQNKDTSIRKYPALRKESGATTKWIILYDVDIQSANIIDFFEDNNYEKINVNVHINGQYIQAYTYVWKERYASMLTWTRDPEDFKNTYIQEYISTILPRIRKQYSLIYNNKTLQR